MSVTKSQSPNISSPNGNSLAVFVDGLTGVLTLKDINGVTQPMQDYINGGGGGGTTVYAGDSPTTVLVENFPIGTDITGLTYDVLFQNIYAPYVLPAFTSFGITQTTPIEVGTTITGLKSFNWVISTASNLQANSISVIDVTNGNTVLQSGISNTSPQNVNIGSVQKVVSSSNQWRATAINTQTNVLTSLVATVNWYWKLYYGVNVNPTITEAQIEALTGVLRATEVGDFVFPILNYKYFCFPDTTPFTDVGGFKDVATNLDVIMADSTDDAFYSTTQPNGLSYGIRSVTNAQSITVNYRVYRSRFQLGGAITIRVS